MKRALVSGLLVLSVIALALTFILSSFGTTSQSASGIRYDSRAHTPIYERKEAASGTGAQFSASMTFLPYSTAGYSDLFQTAPLSNGVRVELHDKTIGMLVKAHNAQGFDVYVITSNYDGSKPHRLDIKISDAKQVTAALDGQQLVNMTSPDLAYDISDITVGSGFSKDRAFNGKIDDFSYSYSVSEAPKTSGTTLLWIRLGLGALVVGLLFALAFDGGLKLPSFLSNLGADSEEADQPHADALH